MEPYVSLLSQSLQSAFKGNIIQLIAFYQMSKLTTKWSIIDWGIAECLLKTTICKGRLDSPDIIVSYKRYKGKFIPSQWHISNGTGVSENC